MKKTSFILLLTLLMSLFAGSLQAFAYIDPDRAVNPVFETTVVEANENTETKRAFNGAIIELANNELLLTFDNYTDVEDDSPGVISGKISADGGRTWGDSYLIQENIGVKNVMNQGIVRLNSGGLALFFAKQDDPAHIYMYMIRSYDEGRTWDEPMQITPLAGFQTTANDRAVVLSSGRIIIPLGGDTESIPGKVGAFTIYSDDDGETWQFGDFVDWTTGYPAEPVLVELKDERLLILIRTTEGHIIKAYSEDGGETWGEPIVTDIQSPYAPHMIKRMPDNGMGPLLLIWNNSPTENRRPLTMAVSNDEGETWTNYLNLEPSHTGVYAYPSLTTYRDEVLITYYTINYLPDGVTYTLPLKMQIWKMADITAGTGFGNATSLSASASEISSSQTFTVNVGLSSVADEVYAQDISLNYDSDVLEFISARSIKTGVELLETITDQPGIVQLIMASAGQDNAVVEQADIVELTFKAKVAAQAVTSEITISNALLANGLGVEYEAEASSVTIQITPGIPGDFNNDNKVSVGDLGIMAANYGKDSSSPDWEQVKQADLNGDGKIDIVDLVMQAKKIKK